MSLKKEVVQNALRATPDLPTQTIAKMVYAMHPEIFESLEGCRSMVRYYRKEHGERDAKKVKEGIAERTEEERHEAHGWARLPKSYASTFDEFVLPVACNRILLLSDIHLPYHDMRALETALQYGKDNNTNCLFLNGDILDMYSISRFIKDPKAVDIGTELEMLTDFLRLIKDEFKCPVYFKWGNHEERWETYLKVKAPELLSIAEFRLDVFCKFGELGIVEIKDKRICKAGELSILHGHEFSASVFSPVNPARGYYLRSKRSMIAGHNHQSSEHNEKDLSGKVTTCWSTGCLCELNPAYMPINKWNHGFGFITVLEDGQFEVDNMRIIDGRIR